MDDTDLSTGGGRDYASVNEAADRLMTDILNRLYELNHEVEEFKNTSLNLEQHKFLTGQFAPGDLIYRFPGLPYVLDSGKAELRKLETRAREVHY